LWRSRTGRGTIKQNICSVSHQEWRLSEARITGPTLLPRIDFQAFHHSRNPIDVWSYGMLDTLPTPPQSDLMDEPTLPPRGEDLLRPLPPLAVNGLCVTRQALVAALRAYVP